FHPLPLLDDLGVRGLDDSSHLAERLAAPVGQLADLFVDQLGSIRLVVCHWIPYAVERSRVRLDTGADPSVERYANRFVRTGPGCQLRLTRVLGVSLG